MSQKSFNLHVDEIDEVRRMGIDGLDCAAKSLLYEAAQMIADDFLTQLRAQRGPLEGSKS